MGGMMFWLLGGSALWMILTTTNWVEMPCTVVSSEIEMQRGHGRRKQQHWYIRVVFSYEFDGRRFESDRYDFNDGGGSSAIAWKQQVIRDLPAGKVTTCFVNPRDPSNAVLTRDWTPDMWFAAIPLSLMLVGVIGFMFLLRQIVVSRRSENS